MVEHDSLFRTDPVVAVEQELDVAGSTPSERRAHEQRLISGAISHFAESRLTLRQEPDRSLAKQVQQVDGRNQ
jgi:hypothetical protein